MNENPDPYGIGAGIGNLVCTILCILVVVLCIELYNYLTKKSSTSKKIDTEEESKYIT